MESAPLSSSCLRTLTDKLYEKRKVAALEIEKIVKEYSSTNNKQQIERLLSVLESLVFTQNSNSRKGGLLGLAAFSIALGKEIKPYLSILVKSPLSCFHDSDSRIRYYASESLYNICKVSRSDILPFFNDIFDGLSRLSSDSDQNVRSGIELLDRLMKDIVGESEEFELEKVISILKERFYTKDPFVRQFLVSWLTILNEIPFLDLTPYTPHFLDALLIILSDPNQEIKQMCLTCLGEFLKNITLSFSSSSSSSNSSTQPFSSSLTPSSPSFVDSSSSSSSSSSFINFSPMVNILNVHCISTDTLIKQTSLIWISEFLTLSPSSMIPFFPAILSSILSSLPHPNSEKTKIQEKATEVNNKLFEIISSMKMAGEDGEEETKNEKIKSYQGNKDEIKNKSNEDKIKNRGLLDLSSVVMVLIENLSEAPPQNRVPSLAWFKHLFSSLPEKMHIHFPHLLPFLLKALSDPNDNVVLLVLELVSEVSTNPNLPPLNITYNYNYTTITDINNIKNINITNNKNNIEQFFKVKNSDILSSSSSSTSSASVSSSFSSYTLNSYFVNFIEKMVVCLSGDGQFFENRTPFIVKQFCIHLNPREVFVCFSEILAGQSNHTFVSKVVRILNNILFTSPLLFPLRNELKNLQTKESVELLKSLFKSWNYSPVASLSLCLLSQIYPLALSIITAMGDIEVTCEFLVEIDKLVQLIESPIFSFLRLELLETEKNLDLLKSLYGLLMLLPQSEAFFTLKNRLQSVPNFNHSIIISSKQRITNEDDNGEGKNKEIKKKKNMRNSIDFNKLLENFHSIHLSHMTDGH